MLLLFIKGNSDMEKLILDYIIKQYLNFKIEHTQRIFMENILLE